jgi:hypothetical protein
VRYTRYNYKPQRKNNNFMIVIILTLIAAITLGTIFSRLLLKNSEPNTGAEGKTTNIELQKDSELNKENVDVSKVISENQTKDYVAIQCGAYTKNENALVLKNKLIKFGTPFIIEEDNLNKVLLGVYPSGSIDSVMKQLNEDKIDYVKVKLQLISKDRANAQTSEMISADIKILNKLSEKDTKSIQTVELKKWLGSLESSLEKNEGYKDMNEIKSYLTALPEELKREKAEQEYIYIYKFIKKLIKT